ncbi:MAG: hypothetical protein EKK64_03360 [Neisseriaceae bacterium]|nr:MAG: hypothetical protein EKK64_03360 [Neisseriaceae bacterium]
MIGIFQFPKLAMKNRRLAENSDKVGCYNCCKIFESSLIKEFTDKDQTCLCPFCKNDCIVCNMPGFELDENVLNKANTFWFKK